MEQWRNCIRLQSSRTSRTQNVCTSWNTISDHRCKSLRSWRYLSKPKYDRSRHYKTMYTAGFDVKLPPGSAARKEKVAPVQNDYERQIRQCRPTALSNNQSVRRSVSVAIFPVLEHCSYNRSSYQASHCWSTRGLDPASCKGGGFFGYIQLQLCDLLA